MLLFRSVLSITASQLLSLFPLESSSQFYDAANVKIKIFRGDECHAV